MSIVVNKEIIFDGKVIDNWEKMECEYRNHLENYGWGHKSFLYPNEASHTARLAFNSRILHLIINSEDFVLDVGCGAGNLVPFMPPCHYKGIDLVSDFIKQAQNCYPDLNFECTNIIDEIESYDWVVMVGITGGLQVEPEKVIRKAWELSKKGIIIDFIDAEKYKKDDLLTYDMGACTKFFLDMGAKRVELYPTRDVWNVYILHKQSFWL